MKKFSIFSFAIIGFFVFTSYSQGRLRSIRDFDFRSYLITRNHLTNEGCEDQQGPIKDLQVSYADLLGDGSEEALVEATTCAMGNGGADIVEVFKLDAQGEPMSLNIDDSKYPVQKLYEGSFRTPRIEAIHGKLIRWFFRRKPDATGADTGTKTVVTYRWTGDKFMIDKVEHFPQENAK